MSDIPSLPPVESASPVQPRPSAWRRPSVIIAAVALALLGWQWVETRSRLADLQEDLARRLTDGDTAAKEARALARQAQPAGRLRAHRENHGREVAAEVGELADEATGSRQPQRLRQCSQCAFTITLCVEQQALQRQYLHVCARFVDRLGASTQPGQLFGGD